MALHSCGFQVFEMEIEKIEFFLDSGAKRSASISSADNTHRNSMSIVITTGIENF